MTFLTCSIRIFVSTSCSLHFTRFCSLCHQLLLSSSSNASGHHLACSNKSICWSSWPSSVLSQAFISPILPSLSFLTLALGLSFDLDPKLNYAFKSNSSHCDWCCTLTSQRIIFYISVRRFIDRWFYTDFRTYIVDHLLTFIDYWNFKLAPKISHVNWCEEPDHYTLQGLGVSYISSSMYSL